MANYERELNDILERHKMDMKTLELSCMTARQDLERSEPPLQAGMVHASRTH